MICAIHSFTPRLNGRGPRPWQVGILFAPRHAAGAAADRPAQGRGDLRRRRQRTLSGHLDGDTIDRHALQPGRPNVLIELRNDLIATEDGQIAWADRLAPILDETLAATDL